VRGYKPVADSARSAVIVAELRVQLIIHHGFVILFQLYGVIDWALSYAADCSKGGELVGVRLSIRKLAERMVICAVRRLTI
jgi:hypothetical protein